MSTLKKILALAVDATDVSYGIWADLQSLAMALEQGKISNAEALEQLAELRANLAEAYEEGHHESH
tara:strand:- start:54 stop:251 length:198 start_codon:yes stop_codon:yes gene_type:complete